MKVKGFILSLFMLLLVPISIAAKEDIKVTDRWNQEFDGDRSNVSSPSLSKDESSVYLYWGKTLENVNITISDVTGRTVYTETVTVPAGVEHTISTETLPAGEYYISVAQGCNYILGFFIR